MPTPIQEKAYANLNITLSSINKQYFLIEYDVFHNYNPNDETYSGRDNVQIALPIANINAQIVQCMNDIGQEINSSIVIKNNQDTVLVINTNDWYIGLNGKFTTSSFDNLLNSFYSTSFA